MAWSAYDGYRKSETTELQKLNFNKKYKIIDVEDYAGFQAILYKDKRTSEKILAIRGTNIEFDDFGNDALLTLFGSNKQVDDSEKYYNKLVNNNILNSNERIIIVGHSLGGFLAQYFSVIHNDVVSHTYTFNAPGLGGFVENITNKIGNIIIPSDLKNIHNVTNVIAKDGISLISVLGTHAGKEIKVSGNSHSIKDMTEILYFYDLAIKKGSNENEVTDFLSGFYKNTNVVLFSNANVIGVVNNALNKFIKIIDSLNIEFALNSTIDICNALEKKNFHLNLLTPNSSITSIFSGSSLSTPALYALVNLNPFIISGIKSNAYNELEKYKDEYSKNYVSDKAKMFKALMDTPKVGSYYDDYETGKKISYYTSVTDPDSTDEYNLTDTAYTFGTNKNDIVTASVGKANRIYTLAGDDTIKLTGGSNYKFINLNLLVA